MAWQEWFFILGNFAQLPALAGIILGDKKPGWLSSLQITVITAGFTFAFWSLGLYWSTVAMLTVCIAWGVITCQGKLSSPTDTARTEE